MANVTACTFGLWKDDVERNKWTWIKLLKPVIIPSSHPRARAVPSLLQVKGTWNLTSPWQGHEVSMTLPHQLISQTILIWHPFWPHVGSYFYLKRACRQSKMPHYHPTLWAEQDTDVPCLLLAPQADAEHSHHRHQVTFTGLERGQTKEKIKHRELASAACILLSSPNEPRYTAGGWL